MGSVDGSLLDEGPPWVGRDSSFLSVSAILAWALAMSRSNLSFSLLIISSDGVEDMVASVLRVESRLWRRYSNFDGTSGLLECRNEKNSVACGL